MITAYTTIKPIDHLNLYQSFLNHEDDRSGSLVIHHGMIKRPGKKVADFSAVELKPLYPDTNEQLDRLANDTAQIYGLNQLLLVHRIGRVGPRDTVLLVIVSGVTRDRCFAACQFLLDEIKKEEIIELIEHQ